MRKQSLTLIEILIVMGLIVLLSTAFALPAKKMVEHQRFLSSIRKIQDRLHICQHISFLGPAFAHLHFKKKENNWINNIEVEALLNRDSLLSHFPQKRIKKDDLLYGIKKILLIDSSGKEIAFPSLTFYPEGKLFTKGILEVTSSSNNEKRYFLLPGYPSPVKATKIKPELINNENQDSHLYPVELVPVIS